MKLFRDLLANEEGATAIEYGLIAALIAVAAITAMGSLGNSLTNTFNTVSGKMNNANTAGLAPTNISQRHDSRVTAKHSPTAAIIRKPTFDAPPIMPANFGRWRSGQHSIIKATPSDHCPPMPRAEMNRHTARCHGWVAM